MILKSKKSLMVILLVILVINIFCVVVWGADRITVTVTVTNAPPSIDDSITLNSDTRTWQTNVATPASQITISSTIGGTASNMFSQIAATPFTGPPILARSGTNAITLMGTVGQAMSCTVTGSWASVTYSTQTVSSVYTVRVPMNVLTVAERTNNATLLVTGIEDYAQSAIDQNATAVSALMGLANTQTVTGPKTFIGQAILSSPLTTNLINHGDAISSPGSAANSEQFGTDASATGVDSLAIGKQAEASAVSTISIGNGAIASGPTATAIGNGSEASGTNSVVIGASAAAAGYDSMAIGRSSAAGNYTNSIALGTSVSSTADNQIMIGASTHTIKIPGILDVDNGITNSTYYGTVGALSGGYWTGGGLTNVIGTNISVYGLRLPRTDYTSLVNSNNANIDLSDATWVKIDAGPSDAFNICGIIGANDGKLVIIENVLSYDMYVDNESGVEAVATNRIQTSTGASMNTTGRGTVWLIYDAEDARWHVINFQE